MTEEALWDWMTTASPSQFFVGVAVLVLGSRKILSEKNVTESFGGLGLPFKWLAKRRETAARKVVTEIEHLRNENLRLLRENQKYHRWTVIITQWAYRLELWAAGKGLKLPVPGFVHWHDFEPEEEKEEEEDEDDQ